MKGGFFHSKKEIKERIGSAKLPKRCAKAVKTKLFRSLGSIPKSWVAGSNPPAPAKKKAIRVSGWLFSAKSVLTDGINPPSVDEIASR